MTGDSQWEYPSDESGADVQEDTPSVEAPVQNSAAVVTSSQSLGVWSYPGEKCYARSGVFRHLSVLRFLLSTTIFLIFDATLMASIIGKQVMVIS